MKLKALSRQLEHFVLTVAAVAAMRSNFAPRKNAHCIRFGSERIHSGRAVNTPKKSERKFGNVWRMHAARKRCKMKVLLLDDNFSYSKSLAAEIGLNNAIFVQDIAYWIKYNETQGAGYADGRWWSFSTYDKICERHPYWTKRQIQKIIKDCKDNGWILVGQYDKNPYNHTNWYTLSDKIIEICRKLSCDNDCTKNAYRESVEVESTRTLEVVSKNIYNKSENINIPPISPQRGEASAAFDRFWQAYPRKVGKQAALKAFRKVKVSVEILVEAVEKQKRSSQWKKDNGQYIPNPSTWLNQGRWEDEVEQQTEGDPDFSKYF